MKKFLLILIVLTGNFACAQISNKLSQNDKIYGLSKLWMEVHYNFVYLDKFGKERWDSAFYATIPNVIKTQDDYEYYRELQKFYALLQDGHTNVFMPFDEGNSNFGDYRIAIFNNHNRAIVGAVNLSKKDEIPIGSEIIEVNGKATQDYIKENVAPFISSSTRYILEDLSIERLLRGIDGQKYTIKYKTPSGKIMSLALVHGPVKEKETYPIIERPNLFDLKWYDDQIAYIALNSFSNPKIDTLFTQNLPELYKAKGLIVDLRNNRGGSSYVGFNILKYLTKDNLIYGPKASTRNHVPVYKAWGGLFQPKDTVTGNLERGLSKQEVLKFYLSSKDKLYLNLEYTADTNTSEFKRLIVPTVILIGHSTASAAEDFLVSLQNQQHIIKIGENTFGSTGQPYEFNLPGGGSARVCTLKVTYFDGTEFVGKGISPDIEVKMTLEDYLQKKDPALNESIQYLKSKKVKT